MSFTLANVAGRAALVHDGRHYDIHRISGGALGPDPMSVVADPGALHRLAGSLPSQQMTTAGTRGQR